MSHLESNPELLDLVADLESFDTDHFDPDLLDRLLPKPSLAQFNYLMASARDWVPVGELIDPSEFLVAPGVTPQLTVAYRVVARQTSRILHRRVLGAALGETSLAEAITDLRSLYTSYRHAARQGQVSAPEADEITDIEKRVLQSLAAAAERICAPHAVRPLQIDFLGSAELRSEISPALGQLATTIARLDPNYPRPGRGGTNTPALDRGRLDFDRVIRRGPLDSQLRDPDARMRRR